MNSHPLSDGRFFLVLASLAFCLCFSTIGCSSWSQNDGDDGSEVMSQIDNEVSLQEDRKSLNELRKNIPPEIRKENDELKEILNLFVGYKWPPSYIRQKFNNLIRKKRSSFSKKNRKERDIFKKDEKKSRESFLKKLKEEREEFKKRKNIDREIRKEFYDDQDAKRKEFFSNGRDKRKEFEAQQHQERKDFNALMREKRDEFNQEWRIYNKKYGDLEKEKKDKRKQKKSSTSKSSSSSNQHQKKVLKEFDQLSQVPGTPLGTDDE